MNTEVALTLVAMAREYFTAATRAARTGDVERTRVYGSIGANTLGLVLTEPGFPRFS